MRKIRRNIEKKKNKQQSKMNKAVLTLGLSAVMAFMVSNSACAEIGLPQASQLDTNVTTKVNGDTFQIQHGSGQLFNNNWNTFDVPSAKTVDFNFSQSGQVSVNRVVGNQVSQILGKITESGSAGKVFLLNPHGIMFGKDSSVNLGSFTASTADLTSADFEKGIYKFEQGSIPSSIINEGTIKVSDEGFVALMAPVLKNTGTIEAQQGTIGLVSGNKYTLTTGSGQDVSIKVDEALSNSLVDSKEVTLINNSGTIKADGGSIILSSKAMDDVIQNAVNNEGIISANSVTETNGQIILGNINIDTDKSVWNNENIQAAGGNIRINSGSLVNNATIDASSTKGGNININAASMTLDGKILAKGTISDGGNINIHTTGSFTGVSGSVIDASGKKGGVIHQTADGQILTSGKYLATGADENGGKIQLSANALKMLSADIDASGSSGGEILLGGEYRGANTGILPNSKFYLLSEGSTVKANATSATGDGGTIINWSDGNAYVFGDFFATPGEFAEHGGWVEISAKEGLSFLGDAHTSNGSVIGNLTFDPKNIIIGNVDSSAATYSSVITNGAYGLSGNALNTDDYFGCSVAMIDGKIAVGAWGDDTGASRAGAVYLFSYTPGTSYTGLTLNEKITSGTHGLTLVENDYFGISVAMLNGKIAIGANDSTSANNGPGAVYLFSYTPETTYTGLTKFDKIVSGTYGLTGGYALGSSDRFGYAVAMIDGKLAVGASGCDTDGNNAGAVYLFSYTPGTQYTGLTVNKKIESRSTLSASHTMEAFLTNNNFGQSLAMIDGKLAVGSYTAGAVYLFSFDTTANEAGTPYNNLVLNTKVTGNTYGTPTMNSSDYFTSAIAMIDGKLAIGAKGKDILATDDGAVYLYNFTPGTAYTGLAMSQAITNGTSGLTPLHSNDQLGTAVAMIDGKLAIGAWGENSVGAVYLFPIASPTISEYGTYAYSASEDMYISASRLASLLTTQNVTLSANNDITLNQAIASAVGNDLTMQAGRSILLNANITNTGGGNLTLIANDTAATGANRDSGNAAVTMASGTSINAGTGNVSISLLSGTNPTYNAGTITLKDLTANDLSVSSTGNITGTGILDINGTTILTAGSVSDIILNNAANDFTGAVSVTSGKHVTLNDTNAIDLGASTIGGNLTVNASGAITQSGALAVTGTTNLTAGTANNITLANSANNFGGAVSVTSAKDVTITDTNDLTIGAVANSGDITIQSGGDLRLNSTITTNSTTAQTDIFKANGDILLSNAIIQSGSTNALNVILNSNLDGSGSGGMKITGSTITSKGGNITLGGGTTGDGSGYTGGLASGNNNYLAGIVIDNTTLSAEGGNISLKGQASSVSSVDQAKGIELRPENGDVTLQTTGNGTITLDGIGGNSTASNYGVNLNNYVDNGHKLLVSSESGDINITGISGTNSSKIGVMIENRSSSASTNTVKTTGGRISIIGTTHNSSESGISLDQYSTIGSSSTGDISLISHGGTLTSTGTIQSNGNLTMTSDAAITDGGVLSVAGTTSLTAGSSKDITLTNALNDFGGAVSVVSGNNITINDANNFVLGSMNFGGNVSITSGGHISTASGPNAITKSSGTDSTITLSAKDYIALANSTVSSSSNKLNVVLNPGKDGGDGSFWLPVGSSISTNGGNVTIGGGASPSTTKAKGSAVASAENSALYRGVTINGIINAQGGNIIANGQGQLGSIGRGISIGGTVQTSGAGTITLTGTASGGSDGVGIGDSAVGLNGNVSAGNGTITINGTKDTGSNGINISTANSHVSTSGNLALISSGNIDETGSISVGGTTSLTAGATDNISLTNTSNNFGGAVSVVSGNDVSLTDSGNITLGSISNNGNLNVTSGANITIASAIAAVNTVAKTATLKAADSIIMDTGSSISASTNPLNVILWADSDASNGGYVQIKNNITTNGGHLWIGGSDTNGGSTTWNGLNVGNGSAKGINGLIKNGFFQESGSIATGSGDIYIAGKASDSSSTAIDTDSSTTISGNNLTVKASTGWLYMGGKDLISGAATFDASGMNIALANQLNDFGSTVSVTNGKDVTIVDSNVMTLGAINASGKINIATLTGDLTVSGNIFTSDTTADAIVLNAGKNIAAGTKTGGDIKITAAGTPISTSVGGTVSLYTGSISGSTGIVSENVVASGSGKFRYNSDESTTNYSTALSSGINAIYREKPTITVTANNANKTYDGLAYSGGNGVTYSGFVNGDTSSSITGTLSYGGTSQNKVNAGTYTITTSGLTNDLGYFISNSAGTLSIDKADLAIVVDSFTRKNGQANPKFTATCTGLINTDSISDVGTLDITTAATSSSPVGTYDLTPLISVQGTKYGNYNLIYTKGTLTVQNAVIPHDTRLGDNLATKAPDISEQKDADNINKSVTVLVGVSESGGVENTSPIGENTSGQTLSDSQQADFTNSQPIAFADSLAGNSGLSNVSNFSDQISSDGLNNLSTSLNDSVNHTPSTIYDAVFSGKSIFDFFFKK